MPEFHVYPRFKDIYVLSFKQGTIPIAELSKVHKFVKKTLPKGSYLITMPDLCEIQKYSLKSLVEIHKNLGEIINEIQSEQGETPPDKEIE